MRRAPVFTYTALMHFANISRVITTSSYDSRH
jgi:hypothetical protein